MNSKKLTFIFFIIILIISILPSNYSYSATFSTSSPSVILFNTNTGKILYEKNAYDKKYPASTTKIMTAILVLENCNLDDTATVSKNATILPAGYTSAHLQPGEVLTINDLLHLLLIISSNDAANVLAEHVSGSISNFANMMNNKAKELGCQNTHFVNANGAHDANHYTTAYDLCIIANYAMKNDTFRQLVSTCDYTIPATNMYKERVLENTNKLLLTFDKETNTKNNFYYEFATGIKTGYTSEARNCLVASAKKDNVEFIAVILDSYAPETNFYSQRYPDMKNLFDTAFENYSLTTIKKANDVVTSIEIKNGNLFNKDLNLLLENDIEFLLEKSDLDINITPEITLYEDKLQAPISKGEVLGTATYTYDGISYTRNIFAANDISTNDLIINCIKIICIVIFLFIISKLVKRKNRKNKKRRYKRRNFTR